MTHKMIVVGKYVYYISFVTPRGHMVLEGFNTCVFPCFQRY